MLHNYSITQRPTGMADPTRRTYCAPRSSLNRRGYLAAHLGGWEPLDIEALFDTKLCARAKDAVSGQ